MLKGKMPLVLALFLGLIAFYLSQSAINRRVEYAQKGWTLTKVLVAGTEIAEGTTITTDLIQSRDIPDQFVTASVVKPDSINFILNQKVMVALQPGDPLLWTQFNTNARAAERLAKKIPKKMRAITIDAKGTAAVGEWIRPNDQVDIFGTFKDPDSSQSISITLLQKVTVLATGKITGTTNINLLPENERSYSNVSLLVVPEEAEILVLAKELGSLTLSLRNEEDLYTIDNHESRATIKTLLSGMRSTWEKKRLEATTTIYRGGEGTQQTTHSVGQDP